MLYEKTPLKEVLKIINIINRDHLLGDTTTIVYKFGHCKRGGHGQLLIGVDITFDGPKVYNKEGTFYIKDIRDLLYILNSWYVTGTIGFPCWEFYDSKEDEIYTCSRYD